MSLNLWEAAPEVFRGKIPYIVSDIITQLENLHAERVVGIFRLNGSDSLCKTLIEELSRGPVTDWSKYDVNTIATCLKRYFRQMAIQDPLIQNDVFDIAIAAVTLPTKTDPDLTEASRINLLTKVFHELTPCRQKMLFYLTRFLSKKIAANSDKNQMNPKNISICIGPNLVVPPQGIGVGAVELSYPANAVIENMILSFDEIFKGFEIKDNDFCNEDDIIEVLSPKLDIDHINFFIARSKLRSESLIPYLPICDTSRDGHYERPTRHPEV